MLTLLAHKLQDFKIKFQGENLQVTSQLCNKSKTLTFQHILEQRGQSNYKNSRLQQYFEIISNASTLQEIIRSLISKEAMKILHGFKSIQAVEYEGGNLRIPFPILQVKMNPLIAKQEKVFHLGSQMGESNQEKQQYRQIVFISYSLDQTEENWQSVIRVFFGIISRIEIYS